MRSRLELTNQWLDNADRIKNVTRLLEMHPEDHILRMRLQELEKEKKSLEKEWEDGDYG